MWLNPFRYNQHVAPRLTSALPTLHRDSDFSVQNLGEKHKHHFFLPVVWEQSASTKYSCDLKRCLLSARDENIPPRGKTNIRIQYLHRPFHQQHYKRGSAVLSYAVRGYPESKHQPHPEERCSHLRDAFQIPLKMQPAGQQVKKKR